MAAIEPIGVCVADAATLAGVSRGLMYQLVMGGQVKSAKVGARRIVLVSDLRRWLEEQAAAQADPK